MCSRLLQGCLSPLLSRRSVTLVHRCTSHLCATHTPAARLPRAGPMDCGRPLRCFTVAELSRVLPSPVLWPVLTAPAVPPVTSQKRRYPDWHLLLTPSGRSVTLNSTTTTSPGPLLPRLPGPLQALPTSCLCPFLPSVPAPRRGQTTV